jgi:F420-non-reducing hydrogenase small subunit
MSAKPKIAICWLGGCGGCDEAVVDINEALLSVAESVDIVLWPVALDHKYHSIETMNDNEIALSILNGNVRNSDQEEVAKLLRQKSQIVLAFGACACFGGTPGLANLRTKQDILDWVYRDAPTVENPNGNYPSTVTRIDDMELTLPELYDKVYPLDEIIPIDFYLPGCPPPPYLIVNAVMSVLENKLPPRGSTLAPRRALCETCPRNITKPARLKMRSINRVHKVEADPGICFLSQGILCLGPATRGGCGESCISINMPCRGCFGPVEGIKDGGAKTIATITALLDAHTDNEAQKLIDDLLDPVGYIYRFSLPMLKLKKEIQKEIKEV